MGQSFDTTCALCGTASEDMDHLFFGCSWAIDLWQKIKVWWPPTILTTGIDSMLHHLQKLEGPRRTKQITYAITAAVFYQIWRARNEKIFSSHLRTAQAVFKQLKDQLIQRILILNRISRKYDKCIERLIG